MNNRRNQNKELVMLNRLFMQALLALRRTGEQELACRLAAAGWTILRQRHSREAERLNGTLHALTGTTHPSKKGDTNVRTQTA